MLPDNIKDLDLAAAIDAYDAAAISGGYSERGEHTIEIAPDKIAGVCQFLRDQQAFARLSSVTATDWLPAEPRFQVVYHLHSLEPYRRLRLKCLLSETDPEIDSVTGVWPGANWYEREVFDLFGIRFRNHPNLERLLMPSEWEGHPLRKDYPIHGFKYSYKD
jgi:NADH-quinone oxidoreductase subunit C